MRALNRKLRRDLWHFRTQLGAIAAVMSCGVALFVSLRSMNGYLRQSRDRYYDDYRFADVFVQVRRAPDQVRRAIAAIPGVAAVEGRIVVDVTLDVRSLPEPAVGRLVSIAVPRQAGLNELHLLQGRWPEARVWTEVLASAAFSRANRLAPGDSVGAILNGRWEWLRIAGIAMSPEYVYEVGGAAIFPDNRRFGVFWVPRQALASAFAMQSVHNDFAIGLHPGAGEAAVIAGVDRVVAPWGSAGAYGRDDQVSHQFLSGEIDETQITSVLLPAIFLPVTAFLLHIVLSRLVALQREQVGALKAFGHGNGTIAMHFLGLALAPVAAGGLLGSVTGLWFAGELALVYQRFFQFPVAVYVPEWSVVGTALVLAGGAAIAGALSAVRRVVALPPAEAMRPEAPALFRRGVLDRLPILQSLPLVLRTIGRQLARRPGKALVSTISLAFAVAIVTTTGAMFDAVNLMKEIYFHESAREDVTVVFENARRPEAAGALARLPGVLAAEPFRMVPVRIRSSRRSLRSAIHGLPADGRLHRIVGEDRLVYRAPASGLLVSTVLASMLDVRPGDLVSVEILEGARRRAVTEVVGVSNELLGAAAYMDIAALGRFAGDAHAVSGAYLHLDPRAASDLYGLLKRLPAVHAVTVRASALEGFERTIAESFRISLVTVMVFACVIAAGIVYNGARVALSERGRELASLRVLGFTRREVTTMLLGEQAVLTLLATPLGFGIAYFFCWLLATRFESELYRIPLVISTGTYVVGAAIVAAAAMTSAYAVRARVAHLDLVAVLKTRE
jgi:putative ABC transport system permease protein